MLNNVQNHVKNNINFQSLIVQLIEHNVYKIVRILNYNTHKIIHVFKVVLVNMLILLIMKLQIRHVVILVCTIQITALNIVLINVHNKIKNIY